MANVCASPSARPPRLLHNGRVEDPIGDALRSVGCTAAFHACLGCSTQGVPRSTGMNASACTDTFAFSRVALGLVTVRTDGDRLLVCTNSGRTDLKEAYATSRLACIRRAGESAGAASHLLCEALVASELREPTLREHRLAPLLGNVARRPEFHCVLGAQQVCALPGRDQCDRSHTSARVRWAPHSIASFG